mmetsp:Transcript_35310/g.54063  ORF Transcript_35310/g.54063 Transcript_35310/m.54063 type:complete len:108 (+) Transcript_35310:170-493(+)
MSKCFDKIERISESDESYSDDNIHTDSSFEDEITSSQQARASHIINKLDVKYLMPEDGKDKKDSFRFSFGVVSEARSNDPGEPKSKVVSNEAILEIPGDDSANAIQS